MAAIDVPGWVAAALVTALWRASPTAPQRRVGHAIWRRCGIYLSVVAYVSRDDHDDGNAAPRHHRSCACATSDRPRRLGCPFARTPYLYSSASDRILCAAAPENYGTCRTIRINISPSLMRRRSFPGFFGAAVPRKRQEMAFCNARLSFCGRF